MGSCRWRKGRLLGGVRGMGCHQVLAMLMRDGDAGDACLGYLLGGVPEGWEHLRDQSPGFELFTKLCFEAYESL